MSVEPEHRDEIPVVTADDVHDVAFSTSAKRRRGYREDEVDAFLEQVAAALSGPAAQGVHTADDVHAVTFSAPPMGTRGYDDAEVDRFLDLVAHELDRRTGRRSVADRGRPPARELGIDIDPQPRHLKPAGETSAVRRLFGFVEVVSDEYAGASTTWRLPLVLGLTFGALTLIFDPTNYVLITVSAVMLIWAVLAFVFRWS